MKKICLLCVLIGMTSLCSMAQTLSGKCNNDIGWKFDGNTLYVYKLNVMGVSTIPNYDMNSNKAPWVKQNLNIKKVNIGKMISRIGSCAFANCSTIESVEFESEWNIKEIGFCAFYKCEKLFTFFMPMHLVKIEKLAFAGCSSLPALSLNGDVVVEEQAFRSCANIQSLDVAMNVKLDKHVFIMDEKSDSTNVIRGYNGEIKKLPSYVNSVNAEDYGLDSESVKNYLARQNAIENNDDMVSSDVDTNLPLSLVNRNDTYALIIGNENYRFAPAVPYAKHDASTFSDYCKLTLGIPQDNIHLCLNATRHMILDQEIQDWLEMLPDRKLKKLIVYYAGHGVPDYTDNNQQYILPVDVNATQPQYGISLNKLYDSLSKLDFAQTTVFLDACFSGMSRNDLAVSGERAGSVDVKTSKPLSGNVVVFSAAQGTETAHAYKEAGHGLFTYQLLLELKSSRGNVTYGRLSDNLQRSVSQKSQNLQSIKKRQTPTTVSSTNGNSWRNHKF